LVNSLVRVVDFSLKATNVVDILESVRRETSTAAMIVISASAVN